MEARARSHDNTRGFGLQRSAVRARCGAWAITDASIGASPSNATPVPFSAKRGWARADDRRVSPWLEDRAKSECRCMPVRYYGAGVPMADRNMFFFKFGISQRLAARCKKSSSTVTPIFGIAPRNRLRS